MKNIDLTSPAAALAYLRSLDPSTVIDLPGAYDPMPNSPAADALRVITDEDPNQWAAARGKWEWTAAELIAELAPVKKLHVVEFCGNGLHADSTGAVLETNDSDEAIDFANAQAKAFSDHPDFKGGQFEVFENDEAGEAQLIHVAKCNP